MPRLERRSICILMLLGATGCPTKPGANLGDFDCDTRTGICVPRDAGLSNPDGQGGVGGGAGRGGQGGGDAGGADAGGGSGTGGSSGTSGGSGTGGGGSGGVGVTIQITSPSSPAYTNGSIVIQVAVSSASAVTSVDVFDGSTKLGSVSSPFTFTWDTAAGTPAVEGPHQVTARAAIANETITSAPATIYVDRTAPGVSGRVPAAGAMEVLFSDPMQITFSEAIAPATLTDAITLSRASGTTSIPVPITTMQSADGKTVTIALVDRHAITLPADVTVLLKPTIADLAGNRLGTVPAWAWTAPPWVKLPVLSGKFPAVAMDSNDRPVVLTAVEQGAIGSNEFVLQLARLGSTRTWDVSAGSPQGPSGTASVRSGGALTVESSGMPVIAWAESQGGLAATIHFAKWTGSMWDKTFGQLDAVADAGAGAGNPYLRFSPSGELFAAWAERNPTVVTVFVGKWSGSSWDLGYGNVGVVGAGEPVIRFGPDGQPVVAYSTSTSANGVSRWTGSSWSALPTYDNYLERPALAIDGSGRPTVVSQTGQAGDQTMRLYFWRQDIGSWVEEIAPLPTSLQNGDPQLVIPADGHPVVAWTDLDTDSARVVRVARHTGSSWDLSYGSLNGFTGTSGTSSDGVEPRLVLDRAGSPIVAWQETDGNLQRTYVWRSNH